MSNHHNLVLREAQEDFELFYTNPKEYRRKVDSVSDLFGFKGDARLRNDFLPTYVVGDLTNKREKYAFFSINPGFRESWNTREEKFKEGNFENYLSFVHNFFELCERHKPESRYYQQFAKLLSSLVDDASLFSYWQLFQERLINLDLIPYHSPNTGLPPVLNREQKEYLATRLNDGIDLLKKQNIKLAFFNGKPMYQLLVQENLLSKWGVEPSNPIPINEKVNLYKFEIDGIPCVLFDRFISQPAFQITDHHLTKTIPNIIRNGDMAHNQFNKVRGKNYQNIEGENNKTQSNDSKRVMSINTNSFAKQSALNKMQEQGFIVYPYNKKDFIVNGKWIVNVKGCNRDNDWASKTNCLGGWDRIDPDRCDYFIGVSFDEDGSNIRYFIISKDEIRQELPDIRWNDEPGLKNFTLIEGDAESERLIELSEDRWDKIVASPLNPSVDSGRAGS